MKANNKNTNFVVCVSNDGCDDLEVRRIYRVLPDDAAAADSMLRVVDESGEDYLYPENLFLQIELPRAVEKALSPAA